MLTNRVHSMSVIQEPNGRETDYIAICSCSWESLPQTVILDALAMPCPVMEAELEGARNRGQRKQREAARAA
jgi:hypothetical protein